MAPKRKGSYLDEDGVLERWALRLDKEAEEFGAEQIRARRLGDLVEIAGYIICFDLSLKNM